MGRDERADTRDEEGRKKRIPLGVPRSKLNAPQRQGYYRRFINDTVGRITGAISGGYNFVSKTDLNRRQKGMTGDDFKQGEAERRLVGRQEGGEPLFAYLMEIPLEWYEADQKEKMDAILETEAVMKRGPEEGNAQGMYAPKGGTNVSHKH